MRYKKTFIMLLCIPIIYIKEFLLIVMLYFVTTNITINKLDDVKNDFSKFTGETTSCVYNYETNKLYFEDHKVKLEKNLYGNYCGGVSLYKDKLYTCVNYKNVNNGNNYFRIIESDVYYDNQNIIFEKEFDYKLDAECYNNIIYFGRKNSLHKYTIDIMGYDLELGEFVGVISTIKKKDVDHYVYSIKESKSYTAVIKNNFNIIPNLRKSKIVIKKVDDGSEKYITESMFKNNEVGKVVCKQKKWHWFDFEYINGKIYLICSVEASKNFFDSVYYSVVFEYIFEEDSLIYKFHYISISNVKIKLLV